MFEPSKDCPQVTIASRWGWTKETDVFSEAKKAARRLKNLPGRIDPSVRVKDPGVRLPVIERLILPYEDELDACIAATKGMDLFGFEFRPRPRLLSYGEELEFVERELIENPGYIILADHGLLHFVDMADVPGQEHLSDNAVTAKTAFALRIAKKLGVVFMCVRHQLGVGSDVKGMPPQSEAAETGYVRLDPPTGNMQQLFILGHKAKAHWRPWNFLEDRAKAEDEKRVSGADAVALFEGMSVRFGESKLVRDRYTGAEWERNARILNKEYGINFKKEFPKHHG